MSFSIHKNKRGQLECSDDQGTVCFDPPAANETLQLQDIAEIEGGIDLPDLDQWLESALAAARNYSGAKFS